MRETRSPESARNGRNCQRTENELDRFSYPLSVEKLSAGWKKCGYELSVGIGIAQGYATMGIIGFESCGDYGAIGIVTDLSARLCAVAKPGQTLVGRRVLSAIESEIEAKSLGEMILKGFAKPVSAFNLVPLRN